MATLSSITNMRQHTTDIMFCLFDHCDVLSILSIQATCTSLAIDAKAYRINTWDINRLLILWFDSPSSFRSALFHCDAIVHGAAIDRHLDRRSPPKTLEIVLNIAALSYMGVWLIGAGYEMITSDVPIVVSIDDPFGFRTLCQVYAKRRLLHHHWRRPFDPKRDVSRQIMFQKRTDAQQRVTISVSWKEPLSHVLKANTSKSYNACMYPYS